MTDSVLLFLRDHLATMVTDLQRLVEAESPSGDASRVEQLAHWLQSYADTMGASAEIVEAPGGNRHLRTEWGNRAEEPILLLGHFDTVWPVGTMENMPFRVEEGMARGPGIFDMKAGIVQGFWAIRALREVLHQDRHVVFLCTSDEEVGSTTSRELIEREAAQSSAVFVLEPSQNGALKTGRKGVGQFHLTVRGRAAHAGLDPTAGASAIDELARQILDLQKIAAPDAGSTVNVGVIAGGTRSNVIADHAKAEIDVRFASQAEATRLTEAILALTPHDPRTHVEVTGGVNRPPMERTAGTGLLFDSARQIAAGLGFGLDEVSVGGGSDGNFCAALGVPVLDGLGAVGGGAHAIDERVEVESMPERAALVCRLLAL